MSIYLYLSLSISIYLYLPVYVSICLSICLSIYTHKLNSLFNWLYIQYIYIYTHFCGACVSMVVCWPSKRRTRSNIRQSLQSNSSTNWNQHTPYLLTPDVLACVGGFCTFLITVCSCIPQFNGWFKGEISAGNRGLNLTFLFFATIKDDIPMESSIYRHFSSQPRLIEWYKWSSPMVHWCPVYITSLQPTRWFFPTPRHGRFATPPGAFPVDTSKHPWAEHINCGRNPAPLDGLSQMGKLDVIHMGHPEMDIPYGRNIHNGCFIPVWIGWIWLSSKLVHDFFTDQIIAGFYVSKFLGHLFFGHWGRLIWHYSMIKISKL